MQAQSLTYQTLEATLEEPRQETSHQAQAERPAFSTHYRFFKRVFDVFFSIVVVVVGFIPAVLLSVAIAIDTKGSPIYVQERVSKFGRPFKIYKFRTMVADSDKLEKYLDEDELETWHREHKIDNDPRVTPLGSFLRKTSLDEIPQFINVLKGDMSVVGPRPITEEELVNFGDQQEKLLSRRPGITGWWQTQSRNAATYESGERQALELYYIDNAGYFIDFKIFFATFREILSGTGK